MTLVRELTLIPNLLSITRMLLAPPLVLLLYLDRDHTSNTTLFLLSVAALSDLADGYLARRWGQVSQLGHILDPLADKLLLGTLSIGLFLWHGFPSWLLAGVLLRDAVFVLVGTFLLRLHNVVIKPNGFGKYTTVTLVLAALAHLVDPAKVIRTELTYVAGTMLLLSSLSYARVLLRTLADVQPGSAQTNSSRSSG